MGLKIAKIQLLFENVAKFLINDVGLYCVRMRRISKAAYPSASIIVEFECGSCCWQGEKKNDFSGGEMVVPVPSLFVFCHSR